MSKELDWADDIAAKLTPEGKPTPDTAELLKAFREVLAEELRNAYDKGEKTGWDNGYLSGQGD